MGRLAPAGPCRRFVGDAFRPLRLGVAAARCRRCMPSQSCWPTCFFCPLPSSPPPTDPLEEKRVDDCEADPSQPECRVRRLCCGVPRTCWVMADRWLAAVASLRG